MVILGGLVAVALFAALIGPYFINWNDYKGTFEAEAEKILGQPVRVVGTASATLLPLPSLTFTQVEVGDTEGAREVLADQTRFALDRQALQRFNALLDAPLADNAAIRRLLATPAPWER